MNNTGELKQRSGRQVRARSIDCGHDPVGDRGDPKLKRRLHRTEEESKKVSRSVRRRERETEREDWCATCLLAAGAIRAVVAAAAIAAAIAARCGGAARFAGVKGRRRDVCVSRARFVGQRKNGAPKTRKSRARRDAHLSWSVILFVVFAGFGLVLLGRVVSLVLLSSSPVGWWL